jgi:hypothetical protein
MPAMAPSRFLLPPGAAPSLARLGRFLEREDPLADDVIEELVPRPRGEQEQLIERLFAATPRELPTALRVLHESVREPPVWFDEARANAGGEVLLRAGLLSGLVLGFKSLVLGYCSPAGNKPLVFSGRLAGDVQRRLAETSRFVEATSQPGGLRFGAPGFRAAVRVRLIHARVRHALRHSPAWRGAEWGAPINQYDMAGTVLLFSSVLLDGLRQLGATVTAAEEDATLHQWRFVGRLMGVEEELLSTSPAEARALWASLEATQALPDVDSRRLTHALLLDAADRGAPPAAVDFGYALCRHLVGERYADALALPRTAWSLAPRLLRPVVGRLDTTVRRFPGAKEGALLLGAAYWRRTVELVFGGAEVPFELPFQPLRRAG